ncbi:MAG: AbrB/MazE/SpoVT family DNA-binding domain-containing protein [Clostridiales bacterium]|nr:AbrB/MazE/SpoVT family DNA-binding domain-containing protein [Clostridiales bacterium]
MANEKIKKIDHRGRILIPGYLRNALGWDENTEIYIKQNENQLVLQAKEKEQCCLCQGSADLVRFYGRNLCEACIQSIKNSQL